MNFNNFKTNKVNVSEINVYSCFYYIDSANVIMATDQGGTFDPFKQFGIFGIAFLIINAVLVVSTLIFFYFYKVYQLSLQYCICQEEVRIIVKIEQWMS